ncbi:MAG: hypothetical protein IJN29_10830 [Akkermansia sp.]|nr:hypothetical protein [Akkermansia sp.]
MKRILFLLSLSGMLFADQTIVLTFGVENNNSIVTKEATEIFGSANALTYNVVSANNDYHISTLLCVNGIKSDISLNICHEEAQNAITTTRGKITTTIGGDSANLSSLVAIFGNAQINGVLTTTNDNTFHIKFSGLHESSYTLYVLGTRSGTDGNGTTNYSLTETKSFTISEEKQVYNGDSKPSISGNVITAATYNSQENTISNWLLMQFDFSPNEDKQSIMAPDFKTTV